MTIRLYDSAWVRIAGSDTPFRVNKDSRNPGIFEVATFRYDVDGRPMDRNPDAPRIVAIVSLQDLRQAGLSADYDRGLRSDVGGKMK